MVNVDDRLSMKCIHIPKEALLKIGTFIYYNFIRNDSQITADYCTFR